MPGQRWLPAITAVFVTRLIVSNIISHPGQPGFSRVPVTEDLSLMKSEEIKEILNKVRENLAERFRDNFKCLIL
jgi:hypothetical protein